MLLKIFIPLSIIILPILLCVNGIGGKGDNFPGGGVTGLNRLAWGNIRPENYQRYWTHLVIAVFVVVYCCYVFFDEFRGYVRLRQAYLTSPQHRLRASATTVLVSGIPQKWCTAEALDGLYDVFPGGIRNIWINRNFDELNEKVQRRALFAKELEAAQTNLIRNAKRAHLKELGMEAKKSGKKTTRQERAAERNAEDKRAADMADAEGIDEGNPNQKDSGEGVLYDNTEAGSQSSEDKRPILPIPIPVIGRGVEAVESGIAGLGKTVFGGIRNVGRGVDNALTTTQGFDLSSGNDRQSTDRTDPNSERLGRRLDGSSDASRNDYLSPTFAQSPTPVREAESSLVKNNNPDKDSLHRGAEPAASGAESLHDNRQNFGEKGMSSDASEANAARSGTADSTKLNTVPLHGKTKYAFWRQSRNAIQVPDPFPHGYQPNDNEPMASQKPKKKPWEFWKSDGPSEEQSYPEAYDKDYDPNEGEPLWKRYVKPGDRDTMRLPIFGIWALSWLPFVGKKVDTIDYCRAELARLNVEIENDQKEPEKYPLMNSAFIQFNHQVAAHMACQAVSHHIPMQMAPRAVEISPTDVLWTNMSIRWWDRWIRTSLIVVLAIGLTVAWAIPVAFTGALSNISALSQEYHWLAWLNNAPQSIQGIIQGVLPPLLLSLLLLILPFVLRFLAKLQGISTGTSAEIAVSRYFFFFLFVQVFLVVTVAASISTVLVNLEKIKDNLTNTPTVLAANIPNAANYFFSYILLQALSTSAGVLVQVVSLLGWFILAPVLDNTARQKWKRQVNLPEIKWGSFFPVYTNFACIGLIYSTVAPLMLVFLLITFGLFWFVYRYQTLYITKFSQDTGGLLFPLAINQLFVGLYFMELCLIGLFLIVQGTDASGRTIDAPGACYPQAIIMIVVFICTIIYQLLLNNSFGSLLRYLPITLEDDAVVRDEEFARTQDKKFHLADDEKDGDDINDVLEERERVSEEQDRQAEAMELQDIQRRKSRRLNPKLLTATLPDAVSRILPGRESWANRRGSYGGSRSRSRNRDPTPDAGADWIHEHAHQHAVDVNAIPENVVRQHRLRNGNSRRLQNDAEAAHNPNASIAEALFAGINDEIEDLTPDERDILVRRAFQHEALRAKKPVVWIPRDELGVSDDEIARTRRFSENIWISNEHTGLDSKGRVVYRKSPPDFSQLDLIML